MMYFHIQVVPPSQTILRFAFKGVAYQYKVLPFGLSLAPRTFTRCMDAALAPLRQMGIRILKYLDDWLILAQSQTVLTSHKTLLLSHLDCLGLRVNFAESILSPSQRVSFLGTVIDSNVNNCLSGASHDNSAPCFFKEGTARPLKAFQRMKNRLHRYFSWVCFICDPSSSGWNRGFHPWLGITDATDAFFPVALLTQVVRRVRERRHKLILIAPLWRNQPWVSELFQLLKAAPWLIPLETGPPLSSERHDMASTARVMGPACVAARREPFVLPERVLNTMAEASAPSSRAVITA